MSASEYHFLFYFFIKVYAVRRIIIDFIIRKQRGNTVLYFDDADRTVVRHAAVPEVVLVFIDIAQQRAHAAAVGGDQDRLVLELRFRSQLMIERFCPVADLLDCLSVSRRAEVERISVKIVEVFRRNLKIVCPASKPFPGAKGKLHQAVVGRKRHISARKDELCRVLCAAQWTGNSKVKRDIFQSFRRHFRQTDTILIQLGVRAL